MQPFLSVVTLWPTTMASRWRSMLSFGARIAVMCGLFLLGWGLDDPRGFFSHPARTGLLAGFVLAGVWLVVYFPDLQAFRKGKQPVGRTHRLALATWIVFFVLLVWFLPYADRRGLLVFADADALRYLGLALVVCGGGVRMAALRILDKQFSAYVTLQENHQLIQTGIYGLIRHPMYLGGFLGMAGLVLVFRSWLVVPALVATAVFLGVRIRQEEKLLSEHFGADFDAYRRRTWRLLPYLY